MKHGMALLALTVAAGSAWAQCGSDKAEKSSCGDTPATAVAATLASQPNLVEVATRAGQFNTLAAALGAAGLVEALQGPGPFTVFAPTDAAFAKLPAGTVESLLKPENRARLQSILKYHVVSGRVLARDVRPGAVATLDGQRIDIRVQGGTVTVDNATVTATDIEASNGVIHVIDSVILPSDKTIVGTAVAAGEFKTLAKLLQTADLVGALEGPGPFTVFAPTDAAFAKLPRETVESLLKPENKATLARILKFHVVPGRVFSDAAARGATVETLAGQSVTTKSQGGRVLVQNATVTAADLDATNGVIHVIDTVILPQ